MRAVRHLDCALEPAREVGADVQHVGGTLLERDERVERRDAVRVGGRDVEPSRRVAERALAHPADAPLCGAQRGEEQVPALAVGARDAVAVRRGRTDDGVDRLALGVGRLREREAKVHRYTASRRIAVALNSAVPDFGSVASIVSTFVATRSGKCRFMNARPGRSNGS